MRELNFEELDLVSGGTGESSGMITVTGQHFTIGNLFSNISFGGAPTNFGGVGATGFAGAFEGISGLSQSAKEILESISNDWDGDGTINEADEAPWDPNNNTINVIGHPADQRAVDFANAQVRNDIVLLNIASYRVGGIFDDFLKSALPQGVESFQGRFIYGATIFSGTMDQIKENSKAALFDIYYRQAELALKSGGNLNPNRSNYEWTD